MILAGITYYYNNYVISRTIRNILRAILIRISHYEQSSNLDIQTQFESYKQQIAKHKAMYEVDYDMYASIFESTIIEVMAMLCVVSKRMRDELPFETQIHGAVALCYLKAIELTTGQGKTLTAVLSAIYRSLWTHKVHIVTANDYLAYRDYIDMKNLYDFFRVNIGYVVRKLSNEEKVIQYKCHVVYISNHEVGFDYLKSNMQYKISNVLIKLDEFQHVIIDEMDLILIDNARIPVIISSMQDNSDANKYNNAYKIVNQFDLHDVKINYKEKSVHIVSSAVEKLEVLICQHFNIEINDIYAEQNIDIFYYIDRCLRAKFLFEKNKEYIVHDATIVVVDEYTGRIAKDRKFSAGIHQALEAKENIKITAEGTSTNYITTQNIYRKYRFISGMTGTIITDKQEIEIIYGAQVIKINSQNPNMLYYSDLFFITKDDKYLAIARKVKTLHARKQPVLIGTASIQESEEIAVFLSKLSIPYNILNAKCLDTEAKIISNAGIPGQVTIATNLAGRGTDIKLGGNVMQKIRDIIDEYKKKNLLAQKGEYDGIDVSRITKQLVDEYQANKEIAIQNGGLFVIIAQKQENRRIEQQFRGRAGRIHDPGVTQTFVSLDDEIFKINKINTSILAPLLNGQSNGQPSIILSHLTSRLQKQHEKSMFYARINVMNQDYTLSHGRDIFFSLRYRVLAREVDLVNTVFNIYEDFVFNVEHMDRKDILQKYMLLIYEISYTQDINFVFDVIKKILMYKEQIIMHLRNIEDSIVQAYLKILDHKWSVFINSKETKKRIISLQSNLDYILDYNYYIHQLFIDILSTHEIELSKTVYQEINRYFLNIN